MKSHIKVIEQKIKDNIKDSKIDIIDNTDKHRTHKSFDKEKLHLKVIIKSDYLKNFTTLEAHRKIISILNKEIKEKIHALEIKIN
tara:strand:- start:9667 stop:9921 length:255 start_codon:yes stop_codon:yes gene_type:complete